MLGFEVFVLSTNEFAIGLARYKRYAHPQKKIAKTGIEPYFGFRPHQ